jgi:Leucine-rich repeat (LRR) protein
MAVITPTTILTDLEVEKLILPNEDNFFTKTGVRITINPPIRNSHIFFTLDGSEPTCDSPRYVCPFTIPNVLDQPVTLRVLFYNYVTCTTSTYTKDITFNIIPALDVTSEPVEDIESILTNLVIININTTCSIESELYSQVYDVVNEPISGIMSILGSLTSMTTMTCDTIESKLSVPMEIIMNTNIESKLPDTLEGINASVMNIIESSYSYLKIAHTQNIASILNPIPVIESHNICFIESANMPLDLELELPNLTLFTTESQGVITPSIITDGGALVDWDWGDGNQTLNNNFPSHTYTDSQAFHDVDIFGLEPLLISKVDITDDAVVSVDLSDLTQLNELLCYTNNISTLDISNNTQLTALNCGANNLTVLDVSNNTQLNELLCYTNNISTLDISNNTQLTTLICGANNLTVLDVSNNTQLNELTCGNNNISVLDVSNNTQLTILGCFNNNLTALDVSNNEQLTVLTCGNNNISLMDVSSNTQLTTLGVLNCNLASVQIDQILIDLDNHGLLNGSLQYQGNPGESSLTALIAYNNLISKGWTITGNPPT